MNRHSPLSIKVYLACSYFHQNHARTALVAVVCPTSAMRYSGHIVVVLLGHVVGVMSFDTSLPPQAGVERYVQDGLKKLEGVTFGYSDHANYMRRGTMLFTQLFDLYGGQPKKTTELTIADWGSNFGWFSTLFAANFPEGRVFSMEGGLQPDASLAAGVKFHQAALQQRNISNNVVCASRFSEDTFRALRDLRVRFDIQIVMSVIHWVGFWRSSKSSNLSRKQWEAHVCTWLSAARVSFVEMVNPRGAVRHGKHADHAVFTWYDGREEENLILAETMSACGLRANVVEVKSPKATVIKGRRLILDQEQLRRMFRVTIYDVQPSSVKHVSSQLSCARALGMLGCRACGCVPREKRMELPSPPAPRRWYGCSQKATIQAAMAHARRVAQGFTKRVFSIKLDGVRLALKSSSLQLPGNSKKVFLSAVDGGESHADLVHEKALGFRSGTIFNQRVSASCFDGCGVPRVYGYCERGAGGESWILEEHAECTIDGLGSCSLPRPSETQLASAFLSTVRIFSCLRRYSTHHLKDFSRKQFMLTAEWQVLLVDLDGLHPRGVLQKELSRMSCDPTLPEHVRDNSTCGRQISRRMQTWRLGADSGDYVCDARTRTCTGFLDEKHVVYLIGSVILSPLARRYGGPAHKAIVDACKQPLHHRPSLNVLESQLIHLKAQANGVPKAQGSASNKKLFPWLPVIGRRLSSA